MKAAAVLRQMGGPQKVIAMLKSRKFWFTFLSAGILAVGPQLKLTPDQIHWLVGSLSAYVVGQGISDSGKDDASKH